MREFFKGWKRKAGVVTMWLVCVLSVWWVASVWYPKEIEVGKFVGLPQSVGEIYINNRDSELEFQTGGRRTVFGLYYPPIVIILMIVSVRLLMPDTPARKPPESP